jgi:hypothetical protein
MHEQEGSRWESRTVEFTGPRCVLCGRPTQEATLTIMPGMGGQLLIRCPGCNTERCDVVTEQQVDMILTIAETRGGLAE